MDRPSGFGKGSEQASLAVTGESGFESRQAHSNGDEGDNMSNGNGKDARAFLDDVFGVLQGEDELHIPDSTPLPSLLADNFDYLELAVKVGERYPGHEEAVRAALGMSPNSDKTHPENATVSTYGELVELVAGLG